MESRGSGRWHITPAISGSSAPIAALGGLLFGYDFVVIGGAKPFYEKYFELTSDAADRLGQQLRPAGVPGRLAGLGAADRPFRQEEDPICSPPFFSPFRPSAPAGRHTFTWFVAWRIVGGTAIGLASNVSPMYIAEVSPAEWRGRLVSLNQLTIVMGILAAQIVNWLIARPSPDGATAEMIRLSWNGQYALALDVHGGGRARRHFFCRARGSCRKARAGWPKTGRASMARRMLSRIGGAPYADREMREIVAHRAEEPARALARTCSHPGLRASSGIGVFLAVLQQWSGINVIFNYAEEIYRSAGYGVNGILFNIVITGTINWCSRCSRSAFVDRFGRRVLMLAGCAGIGAVARAAGPGLPFRPEGPAGAGADPVHHRLLLHVAGAGDLGADLGDLSQSGARRGGFDLGFRAVDRLFPADLHFPVAQSRAGPVRALSGCPGAPRSRRQASKGCRKQHGRSRPHRETERRKRSTGEQVCRRGFRERPAR